MVGEAENVEKELKYALSRKDYLVLIGVLPTIRTEELANSYFDDENFSLRRDRLNVRLRVSDNRRAALTVKYPGPRYARDLACFRVRTEIESPLSLLTAREILAGKKNLDSLNNRASRAIRRLAPESRGRLRCVGTLTTWRTLAEVRGYRFEIDQCELGTKTFYELEIETDRPKAADTVVRKLFSQLKIRYRHGTVSKSGRFFKMLERRG